MLLLQNDAIASWIMFQAWFTHVSTIFEMDDMDDIYWYKE